MQTSEPDVEHLVGTVRRLTAATGRDVEEEDLEVADDHELLNPALPDASRSRHLHHALVRSAHALRRVDADWSVY